VESVPGLVIQDSGGGNKFCLRFFLDFGSDKNEYASSNEHIAPLLVSQNFRRDFRAHGKYLRKIKMKSHKYDITAQSVNKWAMEEIKHVGKIIAVKDKGLQRAYARSTLNGMAYLRDAIYQLITDSKNPDYIKDDLQILHDKVVRVMQHLIKDFDIDMKDIQEFNKNHVLSSLKYLDGRKTRKNSRAASRNSRRNNRKN